MTQIHYPQSELGLSASDKEIGAVELKDAANETRVRIQPGGAVLVAQAPTAAVCTLSTHSAAVTSPGTPVALSAAPLLVWRVDIVAKPGNTGRICVGDASVNAASKRAAELLVGESYCIECPPGATLDLAQVFIDASVAGEGVLFNAFTAAVAP